MIDLPETDNHTVNPSNHYVATWYELGYKCPCGSLNIRGSSKRLYCLCGRWWERDEMDSAGSE